MSRIILESHWSVSEHEDVKLLFVKMNYVLSGFTHVLEEPDTDGNHIKYDWKNLENGQNVFQNGGFWSCKRVENILFSWHERNAEAVSDLKWIFHARVTGQRTLQKSSISLRHGVHIAIVCCGCDSRLHGFWWITNSRTEHLIETMTQWRERQMNDDAD